MGNENLMLFKQENLYSVRLISISFVHKRKGVEKATKYFLSFRLFLSQFVQTQGEEKCTAEGFLQC